MRSSRVRFLVYFITIVGFTALTIVQEVLDNANELDEPSKDILFVVTLILALFAMIYFIIGDIISNRHSINKSGSLSLIGTWDRTSIATSVIDVLQNATCGHVIYINCNNLNQSEIRNIKHRIYDALTIYSINNGAGRTVRAIKNAFMPEKFDAETFYETVFSGQLYPGVNCNVFIYDNESANKYMIKSIEDRLFDIIQNKEFDFLPFMPKSWFKRRLIKYAKSTYIVYCSNNIGNLQKSCAKNSVASSMSKNKSNHCRWLSKIKCLFNCLPISRAEYLTLDADGKHLEEIFKLIENACANFLDKCINLTEYKKKREKEKLHDAIFSIEKKDILSDVMVIKNMLEDDNELYILSQYPQFLYTRYLMRIGEYEEALKEYRSLDSNKQAEPLGCYILADILHLNNMYSAGYVIASNTCLKLDSEISGGIALFNRRYLFTMLEMLKAHISKHIGFFTDDTITSNDKFVFESANKLLTCLVGNINSFITTSKRPSGVERNCRNASFIHNIECKMEINKYFAALSRALTERNYAENIYTPRMDLLYASGNAHTDMYYAAFLVKSNLLQAQNLIEDVVEKMCQDNDRLRYNAYYVKAEILRFSSCYNEAYAMYLLASGITENHADLNLLDQAYFSCKAMERLGLVKGLNSLQIKSFKETHFADGKRKVITDIYRNENSLKNMMIDMLKLHGAADILKDNYPEFNKLLLEFIDNPERANEDIANFMKNIFVIL